MTQVHDSDAQRATQATDTALRAAAMLMDAGRAADAARLLRELADAVTPSDADEGRRLYALGLALREEDDTAGACDAFAGAAEALKRARAADPDGATGARLVLALAAHAKSLTDLGRTEEACTAAAGAEPLLREGLAEGPGLASSLFALSFTWHHAGRYERAEALVREALAAWEKLRGPECPEVSTCLNNLGRLCEETGRTDEAVELHKKALAMRIRLLGDHPETAFSMGNLGTALAAAGRLDEACAVLQTCLACYARCGITGGALIDGYRNCLAACREAGGSSDPL